MLNQSQRDQFRLALAAESNYLVTDINALDIDEIILDSDIVETRETVEDFFSANGRKLSRRDGKPTGEELLKTIVGDLFKWSGVQSQRGKRRGNLFVMDFGDVRACYFDGEI